MSTVLRSPDLDEATLALVRELELVACHFETWPFDAVLPRLERGRVVLPPDTVGARPYAHWTPTDGIELPVRVAELLVGRFVLVPTEPTVGVALAPAARDRALDIAEAVAPILAHLAPIQGATS